MIEVVTYTAKGKGRSFRGVLYAYVEADAFWSGGGSETTRPVWAVFGCDEGNARAFVENVRAGVRVDQDRNDGRSGRGGPSSCARRPTCSSKRCSPRATGRPIRPSPRRSSR